MTQMLTAASSADRVAFSRCQEVNPEIVRVLGRNLISDRFVGELGHTAGLFNRLG
jgi:hypothetical protein